MKIRPLITICAAIMLLFPAARVSLSQTDDQNIVVDSSLVVLNATITDAKGNSYPGLKAVDFELLEDGKPEKIDFLLNESAPFAAVVLLDTSGSMDTRLSLARSAAIQFLDKLRNEDVAAIYNFDTKVSLLQEFSSSRDLYSGAFDIRADGMTALNDAIAEAASELGKRTEKRRAIVVLSDGADNYSRNSADNALKAAMAVNAMIYTVDMSSIESGTSRQRIQNQGALKNFADKSGGRFVAAPGGTALRDAFRGIVEELGRQYTLGYYPSNQKFDGKWRAIELKVKRPGLTLRTRKGYNAGSPDAKKK